MSESHRITYRGEPATVGAFAAMLRRQGVEVSYDPPEETRGIGQDPHTVVVFLVCSGSLDAIKAADGRFRERFGRHAGDVEIDE